MSVIVSVWGFMALITVIVLSAQSQELIMSVSVRRVLGVYVFIVYIRVARRVPRKKRNNVRRKSD